MIVFLYGPDDYRRHKRKDELVAEFKKKHSGLALGIFDGEADGVLNSFVEFLRSQSIFESTKLAVLDNAFELDPTKLAKALEPALASKSTTVLIDEHDKPLKALALLLKPPVRTEQFENLEGLEWLAFIKEEAAALGVRLADPAAQFLATIYQGNSWALVTELQKLAALKVAAASSAGAVPINRADLDVLDLEVAPNYWMLLNGLKSQDGRTRLATLEKLFALNDPPPKIFNILAAQAGKKASRMAEYDFAIKSGKLDYEEALLDLLLS